MSIAFTQEALYLVFRQHKEIKDKTILFIFSFQFDDEFEGSRTLTLEHSFDQGKTPFLVIIDFFSLGSRAFDFASCINGQTALLPSKVKVYGVKVPTHLSKYFTYKWL